MSKNQFWREIYTAAILSGCNSHDARTKAEIAVMDLTEREPIQPDMMDAVDDVLKEFDKSAFWSAAMERLSQLRENYDD